jgi:hypothetical protein
MDGEEGAMNGVIEARIARVARARGCSFAEAARLVSRAAVRRRNAAKREEARLTACRKTWSWARDFLD